METHHRLFLNAIVPIVSLGPQIERLHRAPRQIWGDPFGLVEQSRHTGGETNCQHISSAQRRAVFHLYIVKWLRLISRLAGHKRSLFPFFHYPCRYVDYR